MLADSNMYTSLGYLHISRNIHTHKWKLLHSPRSSTIVFTSFFPAHRNVCRHTLFSFFRFTSSYVDYRIKMSPTCMFCVLQRGSWVRTGVHAPMPTQAILPTSQHITSINIRSIFDGLVCRRACQRRDGSCKKNRHILCIFIFM